MTIEELREEMESELTWHSNELRMLKNNLSFIEKDEHKDKYRKSLIVMLYAHFEGFTKICFLIYIQYINSKRLKRKSLKDKPEIIASCMNDVFKYYDDKDRKNKYFKRKLPDDKILHSIYRRADLINEFQDYLEDVVYIKDDVIDTESNLWSHVISKNFYKMGIKPDVFKSQSKDIDKLVNLRNSIAHGTEKKGICHKDYEALEKKITRTVMNRLIGILEKEARLLSLVT